MEKKAAGRKQRETDSLRFCCPAVRLQAAAECPLACFLLPSTVPSLARSKARLPPRKLADLSTPPKLVAPRGWRVLEVSNDNFEDLVCNIGFLLTIGISVAELPRLLVLQVQSP